MFCSLALLLAGCATSPRGYPASHGIDNFDQVDAHLYRGAQPTAAALQELSRLGVTLVINLRKDPWPGEEAAAKSAGLAYTNIPMSGRSAPSAALVSNALATIRASPGPVFVHCRKGCDRGGTVVACYRIEQGWTAETAWREARAHGLSRWFFGAHRRIQRWPGPKKEGAL